MDDKNKPENRELRRYGDTDITEYVESRDYPEQENTISLLDLVGVLAKRWKLIFFSTFFAAIGILGFALYTSRVPPGEPNPMPNTYKPEVEVLLQESTGGGLSSALGSGDLGALSALVGIDSRGGTSNAALAQELLKGNTVLDQIAGEFNFTDRFNFQENATTAARNMLRASLETEYNNSTGILTISYSSTDPVFATEILNATVRILEERFNELTQQQLASDKTRLLQRLEKARMEMEQAQEELLEFHTRTGIIDPTEQVTALAEKISENISKLYEAELELELLKEQYPAESTQVVRQQIKINKLQELLEELRTGFNTYSAQVIPQNRIAGIAAEFLRLEANFELQQQFYTSLRVKVETTELEETGNEKTFQIIEAAEVPEVKAGPSRGKLCIIVTLIVFFLSVFLSFIFEYFDRVKQDPEEARKLEYIKKSIGFRHRT
ncbi:MAG: GumC family protein [Spirochaetia bacterium]